MRYLLDTSVISEYIKKKPTQRVIDWLDIQEERGLYISSLTLAELKKGFHKLQANAANSNDTRRVEMLGIWLQQLESRFLNRIIALDERVLDRWAMVCGRSEATGKKLPIIDSLLVATAEVHAMIAVTRNVADFRRCSDSVDILNPFESKT